MERREREREGESERKREAVCRAAIGALGQFHFPNLVNSLESAEHFPHREMKSIKSDTA